MQEGTERGESSTPEGDRAAQARSESGAGGRTGPTAAEDEGILTLVCFKCGTEYYFEDGPPPEKMTCEKCGNGVFRSFYSSEGNEALDDFEDTTHRDLDPDDAEGETLPGDVMDLNRD